MSSTGKGDGTDQITLREFTQSLPRLIMAAIICVCISAPLEVRILKPEIDAQLELEQTEYLRELNEASEQRVQARKDELYSKLEPGPRKPHSWLVGVLAAIWGVRVGVWPTRHRDSAISACDFKLGAIGKWSRRGCATGYASRVTAIGTTSGRVAVMATLLASPTCSETSIDHSASGSNLQPAQPAVKSMAGVSLAAFIEDQADLRRATPDDRLSGADRVRLQLRAPRGGHLMILGIDSADETYQTYPDDERGASIVLSRDEHQPFADGRGTFGWLPVIVEFDDSPGFERLVALRCPNPFEFDDASQMLIRSTSGRPGESPLQQLFEDCDQHDVLLRKAASVPRENDG